MIAIPIIAIIIGVLLVPLIVTEVILNVMKIKNKIRMNNNLSHEYYVQSTEYKKRHKT